MNKYDRYLRTMDSVHGAPPYDFDERFYETRLRPCDVCGGPAPTSPEDSSHDDCY